ncbi:hypothetical protein FBALC1_08583 [Flavobacteriales bacterium ALC-1]|nr:hypothetical protein FBALC1_08583 [Flavobacteriales bacterium ALC-1]
MKTAIKNLQLLTLCAFLIISFGCSKDEDVVGPGTGDLESLAGITANELENYSGDLGIIVETRSLVKKGYNPSMVIISTGANEGNYDQELDVDPFTNIARLKLSIDDLTENAEDELRNGVSIDIEILDPNGNTITSESYSIMSFTQGNNEIDVDASALEANNLELDFNPSVRYYLQLVNAQGNYGNKVVWKPGSGDDGSLRLVERSSSFNQGVTSEQFFVHKYENSDNEFAIYSAITNRYLRIGTSTRTFRQSGAYSYPSTNPDVLGSDLRFIIQKESNGLYTIRGASDGNVLRRTSSSSGINWDTNTTGVIQYFKIIALDVNWEVTQLDTEYLQPILPTVDTSFGFNSTLRNCGSGYLEQDIIFENEVVTTYTTAMSETIGFSSRTTSSLDVSVSATAEASFFGNGGSVTGEVSTGLEVSVEAQSESTVSSEESISETNSWSSVRTVRVLPGNASLVYDAYQKYSNVKVPYVKRLRIKGNHSESSATFSGLEIATQLNMTRFTGVITNIGSDYVEVTIQGNMIMDNMVDSQTEVRDVAANCN